MSIAPGQVALIELSHLVQHPMQLVPGFADTFTVVAVDHKDQALCVLEVVPPQRTDLHSAVLVVVAVVPLPRGLQAHVRTMPNSTHGQRTLSWPPTSQTVKLMFLYSTVSTLKPASGACWLSDT
jgi:hypothetical protein